MIEYIFKRLLMMVPTLLGITLVTFAIIRLAPGDPVAAKFGGGTTGMATGGGEDDSSADREKQILKAKVRLGLMEELGTLLYWDIAGRRAGDELRVGPREVRGVVALPGGHSIISVDADGGIHSWDWKGRKAGISLKPQELALNAVATDGGDRLAVGGDDKSVHLYTRTADSLSREHVLSGHDGKITSLAFTIDGETVISGSADKTVRLWDAETGTEQERLTEHFMEVTALLCTPDGRHLVTAGRDRQVLLWDLGALGQVATLPGVSAAVHSLAISADGTVLAAGLSSNMIQLWDLRERAPLGTLTGHTGRVTALAFRGDGQQLASGSNDRTVRIWNLQSNELADTMDGHNAQVNALVYDPTGDYLVSASQGTLKVPIFRAYVDWLSRMVRFDLGRSFKDGRPVRDRIMEALPVTLKLNLTVIALTYLFSIPLGIFAAADRNSWFDQSSSVVLFLLYSMPSFWVATMLIIIVGDERGFTATYFGFSLPYVGLHSDNALRMPYTGYMGDHLQHLVLPIIALTYSSFAFLSRLSRTSMLEVLGLDFVRTARAKGLPERTVIGKHAFRNSLIPIVTILGVLLPQLIGGSVIIEFIYGIPGMGRLAFEAILNRDYPVTMAVTTLVAVLTMIGILISDILYCLVDPRIQLR